MDTPIDEKKLIARDLYDHALDANIRRLLQVYTQQQTDDKQIYNDFVSKLEVIFDLMFEESKLDNSYNDTYKNDFILNDISNGIFRFIDKNKTRPENVAFSFKEGSNIPLVGYFNDQQIFIQTKSIKEALFRSSTPMKKALTRINSIINILTKGLTIALSIYFFIYLMIVMFVDSFRNYLKELFNLDVEIFSGSGSPVDALRVLINFLKAVMGLLFK